MSVLILVLLFWAASLQALTASYVPPDRIQSLKRLKKYIGTLIDPEIPPLDPQTNMIDVVLRLGPLQVHDLVDSTQVLTLGSFVVMIWRDKALAWNISDYSNISEIEIPANKVWQPTVHLLNKAVGDGPLTTTMPIHLKSDGSLFWKNTMTMSVICKTYLSRYPFDSQICSMKFMPMNEYDTILYPYVYFSTHGTDIEANGEWETVNVTYSTINMTDVSSKSAIFHIHLSRKYMFHVLNLVFPMCLLSFLNGFVFLLPASSGEKMGFLMAVFVSNALFLSLIHDNMPSSSDTIPNLTVYLVSVQIQGFLAIAATILVQNVYHRRTKNEESRAKKTQVVPLDGVKDVVIRPIDDDTSETKTDRQIGKKSDWLKNRTIPLDRILDGVFFVCFTIFALTGLMFLYFI
ncbi:neuronal acetylcholine receptor subunit beta-4-like [Haliotis rubra]|uniref:neuronal acetylcholine receptor subunit beta-4-like n=1 Tax=Haliotis rubra TaxID=36100 RepID=UPI001EE5044D|nr:neuronal acetylcholine receptor subunit beta-4-like [Haliotis rubra]